MLFKEKWLEAADKKNSVLCAGLDPAEFRMGRGEKGLPEGVHKREWALRYVESVAPHAAALKPNINYWKGDEDAETLVEVIGLARDLGMVVIEDSKLPDIGDTNDAGLFYAKDRGADAVTYSPFAGNIEEIANQGRQRGIGIIGMCLMSNPEFAREKSKLVSVGPEQGYNPTDLIFEGRGQDSVSYVKQFVQLAHDARKFGLDGVVIGAPSAKNHITAEEIAVVAHYLGDGVNTDDVLVLLPGVGAQGGDAALIWEYFDPRQVIVNVGRELMFPNGSNSTSADHIEAAQHYQTILNDLRTKG